jgi:succinyl-CoA synthetase beta subunit
VSRLYEFQGKQLLRGEGIPVPEGEVISTPEEARNVAERLGRPVVLKIQVWVTGRAGLGGIEFADSPQEAEEKARKLLGKRIKNYEVEKVLVEEKLAIQSEYFAGLVIDDALKSPVMIFSSVGGTGIEEIALKHPERVAHVPVDILKGLRDYEARNLLRRTGISGKLLLKISNVLTKLYKVARQYDTRSAEINPMILTEDGDVYAADCHIAIDDYAVFRHPELGIEIAREFDRPPSELEKIAYHIEEKDHRGTFYFLQMADEIPKEDRYIGFNGAGGGGSMMSMDAVLNLGFKLANYCDTSGNPSASKVYRAAKIILSQPNIKGYFASGSGVASQEQYHSARGLVKAFYEEKLEIPCVIRLGGNYEEKAIEILAAYLKDIPAEVEGYGRDDSPEFCARRMKDLIEKDVGLFHKIRPVSDPEVLEDAYVFDTFTGKIAIDQSRCRSCDSKGCVDACAPGILKLEDNKPVLAVTEEDARKGKCTECLACEIYCQFHEQKAIQIYLPIPGLQEYRDRVIKGSSGVSSKEKKNV